MSKTKFAVGVQSIAFHNGVVILDFAGLSETEKNEEGRPMRELIQRLVLTPDGMLETYNALQGMLNKLEEVGLVKKNKEAKDAAASEEATKPRSPNFQ